MVGKKPVSKPGNAGVIQIHFVLVHYHLIRFGGTVIPTWQWSGCDSHWQQSRVPLLGGNGTTLAPQGGLFACCEKVRINDHYAHSHLGQVTTVPLLVKMDEQLTHSVCPSPRRVKVGVIGSGLAGLATAYLLSTTPQRTDIQYGSDGPVEFEVHVFEKVSRVRCCNVAFSRFPR